MTDSLAFPPARSVHGTVHAPPSKSATNRALVLAALSNEPVEIRRPLDSEDTNRLAACLRAMGAVIEPIEEGVRVHGPLGAGAHRDAVVLDAGASGTAARFLAAVAAAVPGRYRLTGHARLLERPIGPLVTSLRGAGAQIEYAGREGFLPLSIRGESLGSARPADPVVVDVSESSQFLSALLVAAAALEAGLSVRPAGEVVSAPYVETTVAVLQAFGHGVARGVDGAIAVARGGGGPRAYTVPGDWSSALPLLAAAGIAGGQVTVTGLEWPSPDADARALDVVEAMGVAVERGPGAVRTHGDRGLRAPVSVSATGFPDAVPVLAALAAFADGESRFRGVAHLRLKESDRIAAIAELLDAAGSSAAPGDRELLVAGPPRPRSGVRRFRTFEDHRIAMAAALLALRLPGALIEDPGCVAKSYPGFWRDLETILMRG
ncbi:MAG: 3-phosphoshikimate 1-carboxyvinyltransferase [Acidobacteriota bacterium]